MAQESDLAVEELEVPFSCVRTLESTYAAKSRADFERYVRRTLQFSQRLGGRFNPPCEFGALKTASDESTRGECRSDRRASGRAGDAHAPHARGRRRTIRTYACTGRNPCTRSS